MDICYLHVAKFEDLNENARTQALNQLRYINTEYVDWWESIYEDAENVGLIITSFNLDSGGITGHFATYDILEGVCAKIKTDHGKDTDTYKATEDFLLKHNRLDAADDASYERLKDKYLNELLVCYFKMLAVNYQYLQTDEAVKETIESNEYKFLESGIPLPDLVKKELYYIYKQSMDNKPLYTEEEKLRLLVLLLNIDFYSLGCLRISAPLKIRNPNEICTIQKALLFTHPDNPAGNQSFTINLN